MEKFFEVPKCKAFYYGPTYCDEYTLELGMSPPEIKDVYKKLEIESAGGGKRFAYFSEQQGHVSFMVHNPRDEHGYCGAVFDLDVLNKDGTITKEKIKGPWSSNESAMYHYFGVNTVDIRYEGCIGGNITLEMANYLLEKFAMPFKYVKKYHVSNLYKETEHQWTLIPKDRVLLR